MSLLEIQIKIFLEILNIQGCLIHLQHFHVGSEVICADVVPHLRSGELPKVFRPQLLVFVLLLDEIRFTHQEDHR